MNYKCTLLSSKIAKSQSPTRDTRTFRFALWPIQQLAYSTVTRMLHRINTFNLVITCLYTDVCEHQTEHYGNEDVYQFIDIEIIMKVYNFQYTDVSNTSCRLHQAFKIMLHVVQD